MNTSDHLYWNIKCWSLWYVAEGGRPLHSAADGESFATRAGNCFVLTLSIPRMPEPGHFRQGSEHYAPQFTTTHWTVVLTAGQEATPQAAVALEKLCGTYWYPLYAYLRRHGHTPHDAQDLTQGFFEELLENNGLKTVQPGKGKFRSFLLASLKNFLANERDKAQAQKRGRQYRFISIDEEVGEGRFRLEPAHDASPDKAFEQSWATILLETVMERLREEYAHDGKGVLFDALHIYLSGDKGAVPYADMAARLSLGQSAMKMSVLRLRRRFGELLRAEIANTVATPAEIDEEIRALFAAVGA